MVSLIPSTHFTVSFKPTSNLSSACLLPVVFVITPPKRQHPLRLKRKALKLKKQNQFLLEFSDYCGVVRMCKRWEGEVDSALELEVLEFMKNSKNPENFPSKRELIEAGRLDLVETIKKSGGWMSLGWEDEEIEFGLDRNLGFSMENCGKNGDESEGRSGSELNEGDHLQGISFSGDSSPAVSSSGRSLEIKAEDDSGIEGILNRLERQRNLSFGIQLGKNGSMNHVSGNLDENEQSAGVSMDVDSCHPEGSEPATPAGNGSMFSDNAASISYSNISSASLKADTWRTWSNQRAGFSDKDFEAGEIDSRGNINGRTVDKSVGETIAVPNDIMSGLDDKKYLDSFVGEITQNDVKSHLRHLELELSSVLRSLSPNTIDVSEKAKEHFSEDLRQLSDASEFQENEIMNAQGKLRSIRATLAVLEGKMALAITDAQKILEEKQRRIAHARTAFQLLRTTCIVWPNSGSVVLLAGSFDGWATQRQMEKSSSGIFSLCLKLYPGKYEIKFVVDGIWMVDPLRPIVNNNGFENNLLIIT